MRKDDLGDRMKMLEKLEAGRKFIPLLPVCIRLDGKNFSKFTKGLERPYDERLSNLMIEVTRHLVSTSNAVIGFTQSDEISLILYSDNYQTQLYFDGKVQKLVSVLAATASAVFTGILSQHIPELDGDIAMFDCRAWTVPTKMEAINTLVWRELDATKNSVSMAARHYYPHKELQGKKRPEMLDMLMDLGVNWNDYPTFFKRGTYVKRQMRQRLVPEIQKVVDRSVIDVYNIPPLAKIVNKVEVIFEDQAIERL